MAILYYSSTGTRVNGNLEGEGSANFNNGNLYQVDVNLATYDRGVFIYVCPLVVQGNFKKGVMHGEGKYVWKDNVVYEVSY